ncbi:MAG: ImmA/IrrE family metallo-endopeptidase [Gemmatimonadaceae bacterium]|nr:ImmA/IrrE family metallo-endopeptidase [Gemmatimonadaceae bacterium]
MVVLARQAKEWTQGELAVAAATTQGRISKIEHGLLPPDDLVATLAHALDVPESFLYQEGHNYGLPVRFHRKRQRIAQKTLDKIYAQINIRAMHIRALLQSTTAEPDLELRKIDVDSFDGAVEEIARAIRSAWRLPRGPVGNVVNLLERAGVICVPMRFGVAEFDAVTQCVPGVPPLIFFNEEAPMDRLRFTLSHELGHLIMHTFPSPRMEEEANRFAAEFLMPRDDIAHQFARITLPVLASLKQVWRVSMAALLEQAKRVGAVTERQYIRLRAALSSHGYLRREPIELDPPREHPRVLRALIDFHTEELRYGIGELSTILHAFPHWVRETYFPGTRPLAIVPRGGSRRRA